MAQNFSVGEISRILDAKIKNTPELQDVWVRGEITSYQKHASSGHIYITLSDTSASNASPTNGGRTSNNRATLRCNYFRFAQTQLTFELKAGIEVELFGSVGIYAPQSSYSLTVRRVQKVGAGDLLKKLQDIRERLLKEGLVKTAETRRPLPLLPRRVGIVTGAGTAAFRDMLKQAVERYPNAEVVLAPAQVQGEDAPRSIVAAITEIQKPQWRCDVVIVGRGGGSAEDLMAFNDEAVCRAMATCPLPIVSAVGHQIDHPISDDVADYAAATPTDAARAVFPIVEDLRQKVLQSLKRASNAVEGELRVLQERFLRTSEKDFWEKPYVLVEEQSRWLDELESRLHYTFNSIVQTTTNSLQKLTPLSVLISQKIRLTRAGFETTAGRFEAFSPMATLKRGYSVVYSQGKIVTDSAKLKKGERIEIRLAKGGATAEIL